jgi:hypothetical protein
MKERWPVASQIRKAKQEAAEKQQRRVGKREEE